jgi:LuxR family transcriptional regulator, maltose regulon positive regulatory protein
MMDAASRRQRWAGEQPGETPRRVVIGEDDVLFREGIARLLVDAGFDVVGQAGDANDLLRKGLAHRPDVVIADIKMPPERAEDGLNAADTPALRSSKPRPLAPRRSPGLIDRSSLSERLSAAPPGGVVLVCAPAGSGKSVLVQSWAESHGLRDRVAWVSVEREEWDAQRFWLSVIDALSRVVASVERVAPAPVFRGDVVVERLLSDLDAVEEPLVLVVDDLHELRSADALRWLELFAARLPSILRVILVTREDPRLGLHRLRLEGELADLRGHDLSFSLDETQALLKASGIALSDAGVTLLHERTEGWAAGLRLAVISLTRHPDPEQFVREFSGSERSVAGYLLAEVLERQPAEVRDLLLRTSVLERVSGPLADFLTGSVGGERVLQELEEANAFVTALDVGRSWFRYHHLFADLLQLELRRISPALIGPLHAAAARWYEQKGLTVEAIRHAQGARDWPYASRLLADNSFDLIFRGRIATVRELLSAFPHDAAAADPELALVSSTVHLLGGAREESVAYMDLAQELADAVSPERQWRFAGQLAEIRLAVARWRGDLGTVQEAVRSLHAALASQPAGEHQLSEQLKAVAVQNLGIAELWSSRLEDARDHLEQALTLTRKIGRPWLEIACRGHLGIAAPWTGVPLATGLRDSEEAVRIAEAHGWDDDPVIVTGLATGAMALLWLGRFEEAEGWLERAQRVLQPDGEPALELIVHHAWGLLRLAQRRFEDAKSAFSAAERMQMLLADEHPYAMLTRARRLQAEARMGWLAAARTALADMPADEREAPSMRLTAAVIHLAEGAFERTLEVLAPVIDGPAPAVRRSMVLTEAQLLDAAAREGLGDHRAAEASIERALGLAEPEGILLPFVLAPVQDLLERLPRHRTAHPTLLRTILDVHAGSSAPSREAPVPLLDELSEAELRVVRYLSSNLKAPEIAAELFVSTNTIRTHLRHIYAKLDAHNRAEAVVRARQLGLLAPSSRSR